MLDAFQELIDELLSAPAALRSLGAGSSESGDVRSALALLTERDRALLDEVQTMVKFADPVLRAPVDTPPTSALTGDSSELLNRFDTWRGELVSLLMNLTLKDWERTAIDEAGQQVTVADRVESHVEFDEAMRETFNRLLG